MSSRKKKFRAVAVSCVQGGVGDEKKKKREIGDRSERYPRLMPTRKKKLKEKKTRTVRYNLK